MRQHTENEFSCLNFTVIALCNSHSFHEAKYPPGGVHLSVQVLVHEHPPACTVCLQTCEAVCVFNSAH